MLTHDTRILALLPAVGLCSCVAASDGSVSAAPTDQPARGPIEAEPEREPLTIAEAMIRSGRESLAAGHYQAAFATLSIASQQYPEQADAVALDMIDAALGARELRTARTLIEQLPPLEYHADAQRLQKRRLDLHELENAAGVGACEAQVETQARSMRRVDGVLAAWNELRAELPADHAIPIPTSIEAASEIVCPLGCAVGEPNFPRIHGDNESVIGLVVANADGSLSVMPDLLHLADASCAAETVLGFEQHEQLVRVRAFADQRYEVDPDEWRLVELPGSSSPPVSTASSPSYGYVYASSGYPPPPPSYGYAYASSGYQTNYGYAYYGCGGHGYGYDDYEYASPCAVQTHVERDVVIDLARGEITLDIVRTGSPGSALGRVTMASAPAGAIVDVDACGVSRSLKLSYS